VSNTTLDSHSTVQHRVHSYPYPITPIAVDPWPAEAADSRYGARAQYYVCTDGDPPAVLLYLLAAYPICLRSDATVHGNRERR
jgi:hypothetical protein